MSQYSTEEATVFLNYGGDKNQMVLSLFNIKQRYVVVL